MPYITSATTKHFAMPPITEDEVEAFVNALSKQKVDPRAEELLKDVDLHASEAAAGCLNLSDLREGPARRALRLLNAKLHMILEGRR